MKKLKFLIAAAVSSLLTFYGSFHSHALDYCSTVTYIISGNKAVITGWSGNPETLVLPSVIDGIPVTEIRENAFYRCESLKKAVIPESVKKIGSYAFYGCISLESAEIKAAVPEIPEGIFYGCEKLESISLCSGIRKIGSYAFYGCRNLESFDLPPGVTGIGSYSFAECHSLSKVTLNGKLEIIGSHSFYDCPELTGVILPETVVSVGEFALGFTRNSRSESFTITGVSGTAAENYARRCGFGFRSRIYFRSSSPFSRNSLIFIAWLGCTTIYMAVMTSIIFRLRKIRKYIA